MMVASGECGLDQRQIVMFIYIEVSNELWMVFSKLDLAVINGGVLV